MNIEIICIGSLPNNYLKEAESDYLKRVGQKTRIAVTEIKEERLPKGASPAEEEIVRVKEGEALLLAAEKRKNAFVFALDMRGFALTSEKFAQKIKELSSYGNAAIVFLIGGSLGLPEAVRKRADTVLSLSEMTFPHQLTRIILLEQIYRALKIIHGEVYHK